METLKPESNIKKKAAPKYSPEVRERAVGMVLEHRGEPGSQWKVIASIAAKFGCSGETLRNWVRQAERDRGLAARIDNARNRSGSGSWNGRTGSCGRSTKSCVRRRRISRRRNSTADRNHDQVH